MEKKLSKIELKTFSVSFAGSEANAFRTRELHTEYSGFLYV